MAAPTISAIADQSLIVDQALAAVGFTVGDDVTAAGDLTVTAESDNQSVVDDGDITLGGTGANRTIALTPVTGAEGTATITVTVDDGTATTSTTFDVTVAARSAAASRNYRRGDPESEFLRAAAVTKHDQNDLEFAAQLYVGGTGNVKVTTVDGDVVTFNSVPAGTKLPVWVKRVWSTGTTATNMVAVW